MSRRPKIPRRPLGLFEDVRPAPVDGGDGRTYLTVDPVRAGLSLDEFLAIAYPGLPKRFLRRCVRSGAVLVDGSPARPAQRLRAHEVVSIDFDEDDAPAERSAPAPELAVLYEDEHLLALDKPAGLAVEADRWDPERPSLASALVALAEERGGELGEPFRPRVVHRLDRDTSGVLLVARTLEGERALRRAFDAGEVTKDYLALVEGEHPLAEGEWQAIELPIGPDRRGRMRIADDGKPSRTDVSVEERFRGFTLLRCRPRTGRTHQIRVHLAEQGFPLVIDPLYGRRSRLCLSEIKSGYRAKPGRPETPLCTRLTLHARRLELTLLGGDRIAIEAPLPPDLERTLKQLRKVRKPR